jgi:hypothetical protein
MQEFRVQKVQRWVLRRLFAIRMDVEAECRKLHIEECCVLITKYFRQFVINVDKVVDM